MSSFGFGELVPPELLNSHRCQEYAGLDGCSDLSGAQARFLRTRNMNHEITNVIPSSTIASDAP